MAYYRRAKLAVDAFRGFNSKYRAKPISQFRGCSTNSSTSVSKKPEFPRFCIPISNILSDGNTFSSEFLASLEHQVNPGERHWGLSRLWKSLLGFGCLYGTLCIWMSKTVPYTNRTQFVILSPKMEKILGGTQFERTKDEYKGKILPATHPDSVRVTMILKRIIDALLIRVLRRDEKVPHLADLSWEVLVVDEPINTASSFPGGKIVVYTGLLKECKNDFELATVIAHEVGHVVARHWAENLSKWFKLPQLVIYDVVLSLTKPDHHPFSSRIEFEADHISLLLLASAGYDPREVPSVYDKFDKIYMRDNGTLGPSPKKRAEMLAQANIMEEALGIYREFVM